MALARVSALSSCDVQTHLLAWLPDRKLTEKLQHNMFLTRGDIKARTEHAVALRSRSSGGERSSLVYCIRSRQTGWVDSIALGKHIKLFVWHLNVPELQLAALIRHLHRIESLELPGGPSL